MHTYMWCVCVLVEAMVSKTLIAFYLVCNKSCLTYVTGVPVPTGLHSSQTVCTPHHSSPGEFPLEYTQYTFIQIKAFISFPIFDMDLENKRLE